MSADVSVDGPPLDAHRPLEGGREVAHATSLGVDTPSWTRTPIRRGAPALAAAEVAAALATLPGWRGDTGAIARTFRFDGWRPTIAFVERLAALADDVDHHPDLVVGYGRCEVRWSTHDAGGVTANDLACAARTDALAAP